MAVASTARAAPPATGADADAEVLAVPVPEREVQEPVTIRGLVTDIDTGAKLEGALMIVQSTALPAAREVLTDRRGRYEFRDLPPGTYTVQALYKNANVNKTTTLPAGARMRMNFQLTPKGLPRCIVCHFPWDELASGAQAQTKRGPNDLRHVPIGGTSRDFSAVTDLSPTASRDAAGVRLGGGTGAENRWRVDGQDITSPAFGTLGVAIPQEFVERVEVLEGVYAAEHGGASGGVVEVAKRSGTNRWSGSIGVRFAPRLGRPRRLEGGDEALRTTEVENYEGQGFITLAGPLVRDRVFLDVGLAPGGASGSLVQTFTGPDAGGRTAAFDEQSFRTGRFQLAWTAGLTFAGYRHQVRVSAGGGPTYRRRSLRVPAVPEFDAVAGDPAGVIGGVSRLGAGIVDGTFGRDRGNSTSAGVEYRGRPVLMRGELDIEARAYYTRVTSEQGWRLDDPTSRDVPLVVERSAQGRELAGLLARDGAGHLADAAGDACTAGGAELACPVRIWISGGIGPTTAMTQGRAGAALALTHWFGEQRFGYHSLKYGIELEDVRVRLRSAYSGSNGAAFFDQCPAGQVSGGEFCFDRATGGYAVDPGARVDNHRLVVVDADDPELRHTIGYGRVRRELGDLRAITAADGAGARVAAHASAVSSQSYALFVQDRWMLRSDLHLHAGVRWDIQELRDVYGRRGALIAGNVAPRLALNYDWTDEGKSRLFVGYGWHYAQVPAIVASRAFGGLVRVDRSYRGADCAGPVTVGGEMRPRIAEGAPTEWCVDAHERTTVAGGAVPRLRGMYVRRIHAGYEHEVAEGLTIGVRWQHDALGRAIESVSLDGGQTTFLANPGESVAAADIARQERACDELQGLLDAAAADDPGRGELARERERCAALAGAYGRMGGAFPRPTRNYDAWVFSVGKRFLDRWFVQASYVHSRLIGNYDGFVGRDSGLVELGASAAYATPELVRNGFGPLWYDRPHQIKLDALYVVRLRRGQLMFGIDARYSSGTPIGVHADSPLAPGQSLVRVLPRGAGGRLAPNYFVNLGIGYARWLPEELLLEVTARVVNLTDARAVLRVDETYSFAYGRAIAGGDGGDLVHARTTSPHAPQFFGRTILPAQGGFGAQTRVQQPIGAQFEVRLRF